MSTYPGGVFDDALPEGRAAATLTVWRHGVEARLEAGKVYTIRSEVLRLERGGSTGRMLFIRGQDPRLTLFSIQPKVALFSPYGYRYISVAILSVCT